MEITSLKEAENLLINLCNTENISDKLNDELQEFYFDDFPENPAKLENFLVKLTELFLGNKEETERFIVALNWVVFHKIHDEIFPILTSKFHEQDYEFFEKSRVFFQKTVTVDQFGGDKNYSIPLTAAIVELSVIDTYTSPLEKMRCLYYTFDLIFAELKAALIFLIAENSEQEHEIPVVDNTEIIPVLMVVIIKSKLIHFYSNLYYIQHFCYRLEENKEFWNVFQIFQKAALNLSKVNVNCVNFENYENFKRTIDFSEFVKLTLSEIKLKDDKDLMGQEKRRIVDLIVTSTLEFNL